jgi:hypothetical protein
VDIFTMEAFTGASQNPALIDPADDRTPFWGK